MSSDDLDPATLPAADRSPDGVDGLDSVAAFDLFVVVLTLLALGGALARSLFDLPEHTRESLVHLDNGLCLVFLADFGSCVWRAPNRLRYIATTGWIDFLASLPGLTPLRWGRLVRAVQIVRIARQMALRGPFFQQLRGQLPSTVLLGTLLVSLLLLAGSSLAIVELERGQGGNIQTGEEAVWWSLVTMTTVGYGDYAPQTLAGRTLAVFLMTIGVAVFGAFTSYLGSKFARSSNEDLSGELNKLRSEIERLQETLSHSRGDGPGAG